LKILKKLRTASLNLEFTGSYEKKCIIPKCQNALLNYATVKLTIIFKHASQNAIIVCSYQSTPKKKMIERFGQKDKTSSYNDYH